MSAGFFALDALGRHDEAWKLAQQCLNRYPEGDWPRADVAELLWRQGRFEEVPALYQDPRHPPNSGDWTTAIAPTFRDVFAERPPEEAERAFIPMVRAGFNPWYLMEFEKPFAEIRRFDVAIQLTLQVTRAQTGIGPLDPNLNLYRSFEKWKGEEEALAWVRQNLPAKFRKQLIHAALDQRIFALFWAGVALPTPTPDGEDVWLLRATAAALDPKRAAAHSGEVRAHFTSSQTPEALYGRFLLGLTDEKELLRLTEPTRRAESAYYLGISALASRRYEEAFDWFLVCLETAPAHAAPRQKAEAILRRWVANEKSSELRKTKGFL